jgi:hypothetical protein
MGEGGDWLKAPPPRDMLFFENHRRSMSARVEKKFKRKKDWQACWRCGRSAARSTEGLGIKRGCECKMFAGSCPKKKRHVSGENALPSDTRSAVCVGPAPNFSSRRSGKGQWRP